MEWIWMNPDALHWVTARGFAFSIVFSQISGARVGSQGLRWKLGGCGQKPGGWTEHRVHRGERRCSSVEFCHIHLLHHWPLRHRPVLSKFEKDHLRSSQETVSNLWYLVAVSFKSFLSPKKIQGGHPQNEKTWKNGATYQGTNRDQAESIIVGAPSPTPCGDRHHTTWPSADPAWLISTMASCVPWSGVEGRFHLLFSVSWMSSQMTTWCT